MSVIEAMARAAEDADWSDEGISHDNMMQMLRSAIAAAGALGWKLVPVEPTPMMAGMGENTIIKQHRRAGIALEELSPNGDPHGYCGAVETYRAMIAGSPSIEENKP